MAPTFALAPRIVADWKRLSAVQRAAFRAARDEMIEDLSSGGRFRPGLRVKGVQGSPGVFEMTWAPDGRATFEYGSEQRSGEPHVIWRRIGTHDVFDRP